MEKTNVKNPRLMRNHHHPPVATVIPRSISMSTLPCTLSCESLKPRISRLETLEAKMANIEVSLSSDQQQQQPQQQQQQQRRKVTKTNNELEINPRRVHDINLANDRITKLIREVDALRKQINEKEAIIDSITQQNNKLIKQISNGETNKSKEMNVKEERMREIQEEMSRRKRIVNNLQLTMDKMKDTDLDARIHHAETEYQVEREELAILNLQQEYLTLKTFVDEKRFEANNKSSDEVTFYSVLGWSEGVWLVAVQVEYNPNEPGFVIAPHSSGRGLYVQWTRANSQLHKGDRLVEVNGYSLLGGVRDDLIRVLMKASTSKPLELVVLRYSSPPRQINVRELDNLKEEIACVVNKLDLKIRENKQLMNTSDRMKKERDHLQKENMKLGHRISYLEEQVSELQDGWEDVRQTLNQVQTSSKEKKSANVTVEDGTTSITITQNQHQKTTSTKTSSNSVSVVNNSTIDKMSTNPESLRPRKINGAHKRTSSTSAVQLVTSPSVIKSPSVGQLDHMTNNEYTRHILQVHVPFPTPNDNSQFLPLVRSASANGYNNSKSKTRSSREYVGYREMSSLMNGRQQSTSPAKLAIHLKVNDKKIALDDFESENEEWC